MSEDILARLKVIAGTELIGSITCRDAAKEIERLRKEVVVLNEKIRTEFVRA